MGKQFQESTHKEIHLHFSFLTIFLGRASYSWNNVSCAAEVFLVRTVKLVASKLPEKKFAVCDMVLTMVNLWVYC